MPAYTTETSDPGGRRQIIATAVFLILALTLLYLPSAAQQQVANVLRASVLRPFVLTQEGLAEARVRSAESGLLRSRLDSLVSATAGREHLVEENRRLRALLSLSERIGGQFAAASVIRPGTAGSESMFVLDRGSRDGVGPNAPVIDRQGLVGMVREVRPTTSIGMDWTHPEFRASAMTRDGTTYGMVASHRGDFREEDRLVLDGIAFHNRLEDGTVILTSGWGGIFPRGIPIGRVRGVAERDAGWRTSYWLEPFAQPGSVTHVLVALEGDWGAGGGEDLAAAWPADSIQSLEEIARVEQVRQDSLEALGDSVRILRAILQAQEQQDSLRRAVLAGDTSMLTRPAPPVGGAGTGSPDATRATPQRAAPPGTDPAAAGPDTTGAAAGDTGGISVPTVRLPTDTIRIRVRGPDTIPPDTIPPDTIPPDTIPPDTIPPDTIPPDTIPPGGARPAALVSVDGPAPGSPSAAHRTGRAG